MSLPISWRVKIAAKIVLARLPVSYTTWSRLNLFKHGAMQNVGYARSVFERHFDRSGLSGGAREGFTCLELGPGDSLLSALFARLNGARTTFLVDAGSFAERDVAFYRAAAEEILGEHSAMTQAHSWNSTSDMLRDCRAEYLTDGLTSLRGLADGSIDWSWSQAVLEHVKRAEFQATLNELRRITRTGGRSTHRIDFQDHLGGRLNSLRFSEHRWEGALFANSGFYTNRLRCSEVVAAAERAGFAVTTLEPDSWDVLPTPRSRMDPSFRTLSEDDLLVRWVDITLTAV